MQVLELINKYWLALSAALLCVISVASLTPLAQLPELPGSDKTHHLVAYSILMFPAALHRPRGWFFIALAFAAWSGMIELIQPLVNRCGEWQDLLANCIGLLIGMALAGIARIFQRVQQK